MAVLKRLKFAATSQAFTAEQRSLLEESIDADLEALALDRATRATRYGQGRQVPAQARCLATRVAATRDSS
jgi:transposase